MHKLFIVLSFMIAFSSWSAHNDAGNDALAAPSTNLVENFLNSKDAYYSKIKGDAACSSYSIVRNPGSVPRLVEVTCYPVECPDQPTRRVFQESSPGVFSFLGKAYNIAELRFVEVDKVQVANLDFVSTCTQEYKTTAQMELALFQQSCEATEVEANAPTRPEACDIAQKKAEKLALEKCKKDDGWRCEVESQAKPEEESAFTEKFCTVKSQAKCHVLPGKPKGY